MKTPMKLAIALSITLFFGSGHASQGSLGETFDETVQRYGPILKQAQATHLPPCEATMQYEFSKNGFRITVSFVNGRCAWILYLKDTGPIFDIDIQTLLENNAQGSQWTTGENVTERPMKKQIKYSRADGLANAEYTELDWIHQLGIITKAWRDATSRASGL
jgi:hypothetical protein